MSEAAKAAPPVGDGPDSAFGRLVGVFVSPVRTFAAIAAQADVAAAGRDLGRRSRSPSPSSILAQDGLARGRLGPDRRSAGATSPRRRSTRPSSRRSACPGSGTSSRSPRRSSSSFIVAAVLWARLPRVRVGACKFRQSSASTSHAFLPEHSGGARPDGGALEPADRRSPEGRRRAPDQSRALRRRAADEVTHGLLASIDLFSFWTHGPARPGPLGRREGAPGPDGGPGRRPVGALRPREGGCDGA